MSTTAVLFIKCRLSEKQTWLNNTAYTPQSSCGSYIHLYVIDSTISFLFGSRFLLLPPPLPLPLLLLIKLVPAASAQCARAPADLWDCRSFIWLSRLKKKKSLALYPNCTCCSSFYLVNIIYTLSRTHATEFQIYSSQIIKTALQNKSTRWLRKMSSRLWTLRKHSSFFLLFFIYVFFLFI